MNKLNFIAFFRRNYDVSTKGWLAKTSQNKLLLATPATPKLLMCLERNENKAVFERLAEAQAEVYFFCFGRAKTEGHPVNSHWEKELAIWRP